MDLHRRKSSQSDDEINTVISPVPTRPAPAPPRSRVQSSPGIPTPKSAGLLPPRKAIPSSISSPQSLSGHSRTRSISSPYSPPLPSPLSFSFPANANDHSSSEAGHSRRHSRLHSRNLSIFFPRPGSLPANTIAEDGSQEIAFPSTSSPMDIEAMPVPSAGSSVSRRTATSLQSPLGAGFTFGGKSGAPPPAMSRSPSSASSRRGHHHKHSLSHNFFSFLEPGQQPAEQEFYTQPTPTPVSPWNPISPFPKSAGLPPAPSPVLAPALAPAPPSPPPAPPVDLPPFALPFTILQFALGASLWVSGQQIGSLGTTALGYWVVFDAFGLGIAGVLGRWLSSSNTGTNSLRRPYGNARIESVLQFAQCVYLMFSSVYVCKETVEHVLLSAGGHHHHHPGDDDPNAFPGIQFPFLLSLLALATLAMSAAVFENHIKLVQITGNRLPSLPTLIRSIIYPFRRHSEDAPPTSKVGIILSNPYVVFPLGMCLAIWWGGVGIHPSQQPTYDLILAAVITFITFRVSYRASVVLGTVLLQTAPQRLGGHGQKGGRSGRMVAFLRAMKEIERHPQVLHLPAPHIWQFTPTPAVPPSLSLSHNSLATTFEQLVVTIELHVKRDLPDEDVLRLTKWAWEKCVGVLTDGAAKMNGNGMGGMIDDGHGGVKADVTVGVVRG